MINNTRMKSLSKIFLGLIVLMVVASGCENILDVDSDSLITADENQLDSPNDTLYSMLGIFSQLEKLADRYILLGELRGDLMDATSNASADLLEIYNQDISEDNPYNAVEDYYAVINNCNYLICNIDTALEAGGKKVMYKEFAAAKSIRAWTYMQIALNYGSVKYYTQPILDVEDADNYDEYTLSELIPLLIKDISPWKEIELPDDITLGDDLSTSLTSFFPIRFVLGDLYLWNGNYEEAATEYYDLMVTGEYLPYSSYRSTWTVENKVFTQRDADNNNWLSVLYLNNTYEQISMIVGSTEEGKVALMDSLSTSAYEIKPSDVAIENWDNQVYYYNATTVTDGDLRGDIGSYIGPESSYYSDDVQYTFGVNANVIYKYYYMHDISESVDAALIYRTGLLYLRYAEAVNRAGKPNLAFAVLKNGLNSETMAVDTLVPRSEKYSTYTNTSGTFISYANFEDIMFDNSIGIHERGCGNVYLATNYLIEEQSSLEDSIEWVEDKIVEELALETAFEGNRFQDLMRISLRRNDPAYLADKVAEKYDDGGTIRTKLLDENNWYLP